MSVRSYFPIIGLFLLAVSVVLLSSDPEVVFSRSMSFVTTEAGWKTGEETFVWAKSGFKSNEKMMDFPRQSSAFHPPSVCYDGLGYLVKEDRDMVRISPGKVGDVRVGGVVPMKKLWLSKIRDGRVTERRIALYFYLKGNQFTGDTMNLIRFSTLAPLKACPEGALQRMRELAGLALPHLFEVRDYESEILLTRLAGEGTGGWLMIAAAFAFPAALITTPFWRRKAPKRAE